MLDTAGKRPYCGADGSAGCRPGASIPLAEPEGISVTAPLAAQCDVGIVVYEPDLPILADLVRTIAREGRAIWIFQNSALDSGAISALHHASGGTIHLLHDGTNVGLGVAYNGIAAAARASGSKLLMLFDQDSSPLPGIATGLIASFGRLRANGQRPAAIGPLPVSADEHRFPPPRQARRRSVCGHDTILPADYIISSGSLIDLTALGDIGGFREDFFIDAIDVEWCFRAWQNGFSCWIDSAVKMPHRFGTDRVRIPFTRLFLVRQPPPRLYTYVRNRIAMIAGNGGPAWWRWTSVAYLMLQGIAYWAAYSGERRRVVKAFAMGLADGLRMRLGPGRRGDV